MSDFEAKVAELLAEKGAAKGYDGGKGQLWQMCRNMPHPLGEIIYKAVRFHNKGDKEDLLKIAAWAKLLYEAE